VDGEYLNGLLKDKLCAGITAVCLRGSAKLFKFLFITSSLNKLKQCESKQNKLKWDVLKLKTRLTFLLSRE
jgi:hypothetical protein